MSAQRRDMSVTHRTSLLPVRVLGAVLNDVRSGALYRGYSYYTPGYEHDDEEVTPVRALLSSPR